MRLRDLDGQLLRIDSDDHSALSFVDTVAEAQGVMFLCPKCFAENHGPVGTHSIAIYFAGRGVPRRYEALKQWNVTGGVTVDDLSLEPSILLLSGCGWHGWVRNGDAA